MSETVTDLDSENLAVAAQILGTATKSDTVNEALRLLTEDVRRRKAAIEGMRKLVDEGALDFSIFGFPDEYEPLENPR
ncbi:hypothetical protein B4N89_23690 [Embleya scabrispora]|uniref:DUF2191 domain-containing protein n=1 Tax=Embleya scabrispora TaxID=159449 RepID=A0A1T3P355_9ACTN|nr:hypothetical protein [Embleya scabrispora]OPC83539.1 hypothetical protein B4N89_23690 [Embleya scabrispora]